MRRSAWKREKQSKGYSVSSCKWVSFYMVPNWCFRCDNVYFTQFFDNTKSLFQILSKFSRFTYSTFSTHLSFSLCTNSKCFEILIAIVASDTFAFSGNGYVCVRVKGCMSIEGKECKKRVTEWEGDGDRDRALLSLIPEWIKSNENNSRLSNEMAGTQRQCTLCDCQWQYQQFNH